MKKLLILSMLVLAGCEKHQIQDPDCAPGFAVYCDGNGHFSFGQYMVDEDYMLVDKDEIFVHATRAEVVEDTWMIYNADKNPQPRIPVSYIFNHCPVNSK